MLNEEQKLRLGLIIGLKSASSDGSVYCTCDPKTHTIAEGMVADGLLIETTQKYLDPSGMDRSFELTENGAVKLDGFKVVTVNDV